MTVTLESLIVAGTAYGSGGAKVAIVDGGTGAASASAARTSLGITPTNLGLSANGLPLSYTISGSPITTGLKGYIYVPYACTITGVILTADQSGSIVVDIWKSNYTAFDSGTTHPVAGDKITASAPPTITTAKKYKDTTLTGWTTSLSADDVLAINVNSITTLTRVELTLLVAR